MKSQKIQIYKQAKLQDKTVELPASKSISNRVLIINQLAGGTSRIDNLSEARDTRTMLRLLNSKEPTLDVLDAGTTMRFLTAFLTVTNRQSTLTGTARMCQRPIKILVEALKELGGRIQYKNEVGYPPLLIEGLKEQTTKEINIKGDVSSQYISALLMIAPILPEGLVLHLTGKVGSKPYITMTLQIMKQFGVKAQWDGSTITVANQKYQPTGITVEPDWSGASYWYSFFALSENSSLKIKDLVDDSLQGDRAMGEIMTQLGIKTQFSPEGASLTKIEPNASFSYDFTDCPDLAQTVAVLCAAKGISCRMTGLESLKIKETDRVKALMNELEKIGARLEEKESEWNLTPSTQLPEEVFINTYDDHRMAMAFAPLATLMNVTMEDRTVVNKSFPTFWDEMEKMGFEIT